MLFTDEPMEDLTALAVRLSQSVGDARGVLILSRDGLVLGASPADAEERLKVPWLRLASVGEPERGFLQFGGEIWSYVRRGAYAGFVVSGIGVRPGFVLDQIEIALLHAEEARLRREGLRPEASGPAAAPSGKPRTPLHPEARPEPPVVIRTEVPAAPTGAPAGGPSVPPTPPPEAVAPETRAEGPPRADRDPPTDREPEPPDAASSPRERPWGSGSAPSGTDPAAGQPDPAPSAPPGHVAATEGAQEEGEDEEEEVDRFSLAREFSQLLQERDAGADG
jgi:hypothetical protein